jgi:hypothetical protein
MRRILLALCALTLLSGCGGGVDPSFLATAVTNTEQAGGAELAFRMTMHAPGADQEMVMTGTGVEDALGQQAHLNFNVPQLGEMELIADGFTMYMRMEALEAELGKEWMKIDLLRAWEELGIEMDSFSQVGQGASEQLGWLRAVSDGVSEHGRQTVVGVEATHYSATVDLRRYPELVPEAEREVARQSVERLIEISGQSEIPIDVWIDDDQRVRRMEWEQVFSSGGTEVRGEMIAEYVRFGVPVDIDVPDEDDVFDATELGVQEIQRDNP